MNGDLPPPFFSGMTSAPTGTGEAASGPTVAPPVPSKVFVSASRAATRLSRSTAVPMAAKLRILSGWVSFSDPMARAMSTVPEATAMCAKKKALEAEAQAFSTLTIGTPRTPVLRRATCPRIISWPVRIPAVALEKKAISMSPGVHRASRSASAVASSASDRTVDPMNFPNAVMPVPAM